MSQPLPPSYPTLSFSELKEWVNRLRPELLGARIERVFVPGTPEHPDLYFKKEWVLDLHLPTSSGAFYFSLRPQASGLLYLPSRSLKPESTSTRSGFDLSLHKFLTGAKITNLKVLEGERIAVLEISGNEIFELHLHLIPAKPLGVLLARHEGELMLISSSDGRETYEVPAVRTLKPEVLAKIPYRPSLFSSLSYYQSLWFSSQQATALFQRKQRILGQLQTHLDTLQSKTKSLQEQLTKTEAEPDWNYYGSLLQTHFYAKPEATNCYFYLEDYEKEIKVRVPADPKLNLKQQLEKFFHSAKRKKRRLEETVNRLTSLAEKESQLNEKLSLLHSAGTLRELLDIEPKKEILKGKEHKKLAEFSGKQYRSKEGLTLLSGRNLSENLELTFKIARGNDLWFHVKGRPGAHTVIILPPKRSASLDSLLDAAHLCILHSGGKDWGKTEVDYTFRKYVKKIKNQTDVSYTHNKTLMVIQEPERLTRLFASE